MAERVAFAARWTGWAERRRRRSCASAAASGTSVPRRAARAMPRTGLEPAALDAALDPSTYLGSRPELVDRALALYAELAAAERGRCVTLHYRLDGPHERSAARAVQLARDDPRDVGSAGAPLTDAVPARPVRPARARALAGAARPVFDRRIWARRARPARRARHRAGLVLRPLDRRDGRHVARLGSAGTDRPARPLLHGTASAAARAVAGACGDGARGRGLPRSPTPCSPAGSRRLAPELAPASRSARCSSRHRPRDMRPAARRSPTLDLRDRLAAIEAPTLVVTGDGGSRRPPETRRAARGGDLRRAPRRRSRTPRTSRTSSSRRRSRSTCSPT